MRFIHTADIHLGAAPDSRMPWAKNRPEELWNTFYDLLDEAEKSGTDLILIAGDMFHRQPLKRELKELDYRFSQLTHAVVAIIAGNHDYISDQSFYKDFEWPENVIFLRRRKISYKYIEPLNTFVYGMSYDRAEITENVYDDLHPLEHFRDGTKVPEGSSHILLAHGGDAQHIPVSTEKLKMSGFDYVALGHIHKPWMDEYGRMAWCGALEPTDRGDEGEHGYIRGSIENGETDIEFVPFAKRSYKTLTSEMTADMTMGQLTEQIREQLNENGQENMYQIILKGFRGADFEPDTDDLMRLGRILSVTDETVPDFDYEQIWRENKGNIIGMFIERIGEMDISDDLKSKALFYGMKAFYQVK